MSRPKRNNTFERFFQSISRMSTWTVMYHQALASSMGLNPTDLKCASLLFETGPITAGQLAELMALTSGAVTGVIDRLEQIGLVERNKDPKDRRQVVVHLTKNPERLEEFKRLFRSLHQSTKNRLEGQFNDEQMELILEFIGISTEILKSETTKLRVEHKNKENATS